MRGLLFRWFTVSIKPSAKRYAWVLVGTKLFAQFFWYDRDASWNGNPNSGFSI
jgi:hypothetical protein